MPKLIIIRGASGVGKSTIARNVAEAMGKGTAHVNVDIFPHEMMIDWMNIPMKLWNFLTQRDIQVIRWKLKSQLIMTEAMTLILQPGQTLTLQCHPVSGNGQNPG